MSDSKRKYEEMLEDGYIPKKRKPFLPKTLDEYLSEESSSSE